VIVFQINYVDIRPQALGRGLSAWSAATSDLVAGWESAVAEVRRVSAEKPWGDDAAGLAFQNAYTQGDGPNQAIDKGTTFVNGMGDLGSLVRRAAENATGMDADQARAVRNILRRI
jgi:hypothetical protein